MSGYSNPIFVTYTFDVAGASASTQRIIGPKGLNGRIVDLAISASTAFVGTSTPTTLLVKDSSGGTTNYATLTAGTAGSPLQINNSVTAVGTGDAPTDTVNGIKKVHELPIDTAINVQVVAGTGGAPAGAGKAHLTVAWY
jgi:hypothetical protein